ncbi:MAG: hypothetical protein WDO70_00210 [Alphaproteobacteria bacterium]
MRRTRSYLPSNIAALKDALRACKGEQVTIIMTSSGQSCPSCHSKEEIVARHLRTEGFDAPFVVSYGATFEQTANVARFHDEPYLLDLFRQTQAQVLRPMVRHKVAPLEKLPSFVQRIFDEETLALPTAYAGLIRSHMVRGRGGGGRDAELMKLTGGGTDERARGDIFAIAEVGALRAACRRRKEEGAEQPWRLGHPSHPATLYTTTQDIGPLAMAECQWAGVSEIVSVRYSHPNADRQQTQEAPWLANREFFRIIAGHGYNSAESAIKVVRDPNFANLAQKAWRQKLDKEGDGSLYNGAQAGIMNRDDLTRMRKLYAGIPLSAG